MKFFYLFYLTFFLLVTNLQAAEYSCDGEEVTAISNATDVVTVSYYEGEDTPQQARYFIVQPQNSGYLTIRQESTKPTTSGYKNHKLQIGTTCGTYDIYDGASTTSDSYTLHITGGETYYVRVVESNTKNVLNFNIDFKFDPYVSYECPGQVLEQISSSTDTAEESYSEGEDTAQEARYFQFTPNQDGYVIAKMKNNKPVSGYYNHSLKVGTSCDGSDLYNGGAHVIDSHGFAVQQGTTYYVKVEQANYKEVLNFDIDFKFNTDETLKNYAGDYHCSQPHAFELRTNYILPGDLVAIGNSNICADVNYDGICDDDQTQRNDHTHIIFINSQSSSQVDSSHDGLENTSSAILNLPEGATVQWAGLYWQGQIWDINTFNTDTENRNGSIENGIVGQQRKEKAPTIKFKTPNMSTYQELTADEHYNVLLKRKTFGYDYEGIIRYEEHYQSYKDVTELLQNLANDENFHVNGGYWVANIQATPGKLDYPGVEAAWTLQVIYELPEQNPRSLSINDGYVALYGTASEGSAYAQELNDLYDFNCGTNNTATGIYAYKVDFDVTGFLTPKDPDFATDLSLFLTESDPEDSSTTEYLTVTKKDGTTSLVDGYNAWNYEITNKDGSDNLNRIPDYIYPIGVTIKNYHQVGILDTEQTSTHITFSTDSDRLLLGVIGFATDLRKPNLCYDYAYSQYGKYFTETYDQNTSPMLQGTVFTGEPVEVKLYVKNTEDSDIVAEDVFINILDLNTSQVTYKNNSIEITYPNSLTRTPIPDNSLDVANDNSYIKDIPIGDVNGFDYFYTYYQLDPVKTDLNTSIKARVDYTITLAAGNSEITIPYHVYLNSDIPICTASSVYTPAKGIFNIVHNDYYQLDYDESSNLHYYNLPTQVASRAGKFKLLVFDPDDSEYNTLLEDHNILYTEVEMIDVAAFHDTNASCYEPTSAISKKVSLIIDDNATSVLFDKDALESAIAEGRTDLTSSGEFYQTAKQNVAFRTIYYENVFDQYNQPAFKQTDTDSYEAQWSMDWQGSNCVGDVNDNGESNNNDKVSNYCQDGHAINSADLIKCVKCVSVIKYICSRDNFAIRPEAFLMQIDDQNQTDTTQHIDITTLANSGIVQML